MHMIRSRSSLVLSVVSTLATAALVPACGGGSAALDRNVVTNQAPLAAESVIHEMGGALAFTTADGGTARKIMGSGSSAATSVMSSSGSSSTQALTAMGADLPPPAMLRVLVGRRLTNQMVGLQLPSMMTPEEKYDETGKEVRRLMQERLFVDTNLESTGSDRLVYWLHPDPTCRPLSQDSDPPGTMPAIDAKCADDLTKVEIRIAVSPDGDGARFVVLVGPARLELVAVTIHSDQIAFEVDLPQTKAATDYIHQQIPDGNPTGSYDRLTGKLRASVTKLGPAKVTLAFAITGALDVAPAGGGEFTSAPADPLFAITGDGNARTAELQAGLGATDILTTWDPHNTGVANHDLHVALGGVYGKLTLDDGAQQILLTDVGVGETKVMVRSSTIFDLNLNAGAMRRFSGKLTVNADGGARAELTPKLDLGLAFDYDAIASDFPAPPDALIAHETYGVSLVNSAGAVIVEEVKSTASFGGGIRVVAGTLTLNAASVPAETVTVPAGQCLVARSPAPDGSHPLLGHLTAAPCE